MPKNLLTRLGEGLLLIPSFAGVAQLVEHHLAKVDVESSSLFARSIFRKTAGGDAGGLFVFQALAPPKRVWGKRLAGEGGLVAEAAEATILGPHLPKASLRKRVAGTGFRVAFEGARGCFVFERSKALQAPRAGVCRCPTTTAVAVRQSLSQIRSHQRSIENN